MERVGTIRVYESNKLTFELRPHLTVIRTGLQSFYLAPSASYWKKRERLIRTLIELGKIEDLNQLAGFCGKEVKWVGTSISRPTEFEIVQFRSTPTMIESVRHLAIK